MATACSGFWRRVSNFGVFSRDMLGDGHLSSRRLFATQAGTFGGKEKSKKEKRRHERKEMWVLTFCGAVSPDFHVFYWRYNPLQVPAQSLFAPLCPQPAAPSPSPPPPPHTPATNSTSLHPTPPSSKHFTHPTLLVAWLPYIPLKGLGLLWDRFW